MKVEGIYQGINWYGSYELAWIVWNIKIKKQRPKRCIDKFPYMYKHEVHFYTPDFIGYRERKPLGL